MTTMSDTQPAPAAFRSRLISLHVALAAFFLPVGVMFLVTGALYTFSFKGSYHSQTHDVQLQQPLEADLAALVTLATQELRARELSLPTGNAGIKKIGPGWQLEWTGANRDVLLAPTADAAVAKLTVKSTTPYRRLVQLHKAKGGLPFKIFAGAWAAGLLALFISGFALAWALPGLRRLALTSLGIGAAATIVLIMIG